MASCSLQLLRLADSGRKDRPAALSKMPSLLLQGRVEVPALTASRAVPNRTLHYILVLDKVLGCAWPTPSCTTHH
jgi:hypothetical protein